MSDLPDDLSDDSERYGLAVGDGVLFHDRLCCVVGFAVDPEEDANDVLIKEHDGSVGWTVPGMLKKRADESFFESMERLERGAYQLGLQRRRAERQVAAVREVLAKAQARLASADEVLERVRRALEVE